MTIEFDDRIRVVVVEDEQPILSALCKTINEYCPQCIVCGTATDGIQAVDIVEAVQPDVVLTDIEMPMMNGLDLLSRLHDEHPEIIPVIISGYSSFDYARKAIKYDAFDYLLKPILPQEVIELFERIRIEISHMREAMESKLLHTLFSQRGANDSKESAHAYYCVVLHVAPWNFNPELDAVYIRNDLNAIGSVVNAFLEKSKYKRILKTTGLDTREVICLVTDYEAGGIDFIRGLAEDMEKAFRNADTPVTILGTDKPVKAERLFAVYHGLRKRMYDSIIFDGYKVELVNVQNLIENHRDVNPIPASLLTHARKEAIKQYYANRNGEQIDRMVRETMEQCERSNVTQRVLENTLKELVSFCFGLKSERERITHELIDKEVEDIIRKSSHYTELIDETVSLIDELMKNARKGDAAKSAMNIVDKVQAYLDEHYAQPVNTGMLSREFGMVPSYLSLRFRERKGVSPMEYLIQMRIRKARLIMETEPDVPIKEVAERVGFSDALYFSKVFKNRVGVAPSYYKGNKLRGDA